MKLLFVLMIVFAAPLVAGINDGPDGIDPLGHSDNDAGMDGAGNNGDLISHTEDPDPIVHTGGVEAVLDDGIPF